MTRNRSLDIRQINGRTRTNVRKQELFEKLAEKFIKVRLPSGEITEIPKIWIDGVFEPGAFKIRRTAARFIADQPNLGENNGPHLTPRPGF